MIICICVIICKLLPLCSYLGWPNDWRARDMWPFGIQNDVHILIFWENVRARIGIKRVLVFRFRFCGLEVSSISLGLDGDAAKWRLALSSDWISLARLGENRRAHGKIRAIFGDVCIRVWSRLWGYIWRTTKAILQRWARESVHRTRSNPFPRTAPDYKFWMGYKKKSGCHHKIPCKRIKKCWHPGSVLQYIPAVCKSIPVRRTGLTHHLPSSISRRSPASGPLTVRMKCRGFVGVSAESGYLSRYSPCQGRVALFLCSPACHAEVLGVCHGKR